MGEWQDAPAWLVELVRGNWGEPEWRAWEDVWKPALATRGVMPDMLNPVGDPARPLAISTSPPDARWCQATIDWEADGNTAVLDALRRLVDDLDAAGASSG